MSSNYSYYYITLLFFFNDTATTEIYTLPYTTLFRSYKRFIRKEAPEKHYINVARAATLLLFLMALIVTRYLTTVEGAWKRSEEHTSELQSQSNLVCRLLLEKKKK